MSEALQILKNTGSMIRLDPTARIIDSVLSDQDTFALICLPGRKSIFQVPAMMKNLLGDFSL
jgi:hypothetical protein